jgi:NADH-quinone oxidoreductase subunit N
MMWGSPLGWSSFFYILAIVTMTVGNIAALTQGNLKRMLAYSSVAQGGYVLVGIVAGTTRGLAAALVYLLAYMFTQLGAFAVVAALRDGRGRGDQLQDLSGLYGTNPATALAMLIFMLSLAGLPPTAGFMAKFAVFGAAVDAGYIGLAVIGVLNSAVSLYYYVRVVVFMWASEPGTDSTSLKLSPGMAAALVVAVAGTVLLGIYPRLLFDVAADSASTLGVAPILGLR